MERKLPLFALLAIIAACRPPEAKQPEGQLEKAYPEYAKKNDLPALEIDTHPGPRAVRASSLESDRNAAEPDFKKEYAADSVSLAYLTGHFDPAKDSRFVKVAAKWGNKASMFMRREAYDAFLKMAEAAAADGVNLKIISATRTFSQQKGIWESKWTGKTPVDGRSLPKTIADPKKRALKILEVSSMPGTSRHHWGTDVDLNNLSDGYFTKKNSTGEKIYSWLSANAGEFGFCQPYSAGRATGYHEEKWHWSYAPLSRDLVKLARARLRDEEIRGFLGAETAVEIGAVKNYVLGINPDCF